jgi:ribonuclease HI
MYIAYIDGAARGNPGHAGIGIVIKKNNQIIKSISKYIGRQTNNVAEYSALLTLLDYSIDNNLSDLTVYSDSELLVKQINGQYKVKNLKLINLYNQCKLLINKLNSFSINHIKRELNEEADKLANIGIDNRKEIYARNR